MRRLELRRKGSEDGRDGAVVRGIGGSLVGPDGIGTEATFIKPFLAFLEVIGTADEFETKSIAVGLGVLNGVRKMGWLTT